MDVSHASTLSRLAGVLLALAGACPVALGDGAEPQEPSSLVVMASDGEVLESSSAAGSELIVRASEDEFEMASDVGDAPAVQDEGVIAVANAARPSLSIIADEAVTPAAARGAGNMLRSGGNQGWLGRGPRRPNQNSGIQQGNRSLGRVEAGGSTQPPHMPAASKSPSKVVARSSTGPASQSGGVPAKAAATPAAAKPVSASELLLEAYELSLSASVETEYSKIVRSCAEAMRLGLNTENRQFGLQLSAWALNRRGQSRAEQGQDALALADFRAAIEFDPDCWRALHNRGVTLAQTGQFAEAFDDMSRVIELNPQHAKAFSNRATLYVQAGDMERAVADYQAALEIDPQLVPALVGHARVCHMMGRLEDALASFDTAIKLEDATAEIICSRADLLVDLGQYSDALQDYARAIDLDPKFEHAYRNGAWLLATCPDEEVRDVDAAIKGAQQALECGYGDRHAALDTMAAALANAGRFDEAIAALQQAIEVAPEDARPTYQARLELYEAGEPYRTQALGRQGEVQTAEFVEVDG